MSHHVLMQWWVASGEPKTVWVLRHWHSLYFQNLTLIKHHEPPLRWCRSSGAKHDKPPSGWLCDDGCSSQSEVGISASAPEGDTPPGRIVYSWASQFYSLLFGYTALLNLSWLWWLVSCGKGHRVDYIHRSQPGESSNWKLTSGRIWIGMAWRSQIFYWRDEIRWRDRLDLAPTPTRKRPREGFAGLAAVESHSATSTAVSRGVICRMASDFWKRSRVDRNCECLVWTKNVVATLLL
jgi:hypothetical protein